jgi:biopolymer transport protein ExbD
MSHGHGGDGAGTIEPNLTPLLDLVLQLLMLFMICGNYASESNDPVELARSQTAKQLADTDATQPGKADEQDFLFITVKPYHNAEGVRSLALEEIGNRLRQGMYTEGVAAQNQKLVDSIYHKLQSQDLLDNEELGLLKELNIPANSEKDLAEHMQEKTRKDLMPTFKDGDSYVIVPGEDAMKPDDNLVKWLHDTYDTISAKHGGQVKTTVVIRPDGNMDYAVVYRILKMCKDAHFTTLKVRALIAKGVKS